MTQSFFYKCSTDTLTDNDGSGAIWIFGITNTLSITNNFFLSCTAKASAGAFRINSCTNKIKGPQIINNCRFIDCNATKTTPDGGAVWVRANSELIGLTDCLFSVCNSGDNGGAFRINYIVGKSALNLIHFCFFNKNTAPHGNDVSFASFEPNNNEPVCKHCFSTSNSKLIGYYLNAVWYMTDVNWLPQGTLEIIVAPATAPVRIP